MRKLNILDSNNWEIFVWQKEIEEDGNKIKHSVKYLKHKTNGHIITSQFKAWNDTIRQMMWLDLVMGPIQREAEKTDDKVFVVQDCIKLLMLRSIMSILICCLPFFQKI